MATPDFNSLWNTFPAHPQFPHLIELFTFIGGELEANIQVEGFGPDGNTCATRMSRALNYSGLPISAARARSMGLNPLIGADKKAYLFRVSELRTYLERTLAVKRQTVYKDFGKAFTGQRGIVAFRIIGWRDASGHIALWNGSAFREHHDDYRGFHDNPATVKIEKIAEMTLWAL